MTTYGRYRIRFNSRTTMQRPDESTLHVYMVFDVESIGLHGEGFQAGWVVIDRDGLLFDSGWAGCHPDEADGSPADREWVKANVPDTISHNAPDTASVREHFWRTWAYWQHKKSLSSPNVWRATLWSDCVWPVESNFLSACVADKPERQANGPYPVYDVMTLRLAAGLDPHERCGRLSNELPEHDALADARQSARLLVEAFKKLRGET